MKSLALLLLFFCPNSALCNRASFVLALPSGDLSSAVRAINPDATVVNSTPVQHVRFPLSSDNTVSLLLYRVIRSSRLPGRAKSLPGAAKKPDNAALRRWSIWIVTNEKHSDEKLTRKVFQRLKVEGRKRGNLLGPWSIREFISFIGDRVADDTESVPGGDRGQSVPVIIRTRFERNGRPISPWVLSGDDPSELGTRDLSDE